MDNYSDILTERLDGQRLLITLNRPEAHNALRNQLLAELADALEHAAEDDDILCVVVTGGLRVFAAGADIKEMAALDTVGVLNDRRPNYWKSIRNFPKPLIAAVNGLALGAGCELLMHADIVIAGDTAELGQPEIRLGIIPGAGGTQRLIRTVGKSLASRMVMTGERIDAATAQGAGLVSEVCPPELTIERALALASRIACQPPLALRLAKEVLLKSYEMPLEAALDLERKAFALLAATEDRAEGINAFKEKRQPIFTGR